LDGLGRCRQREPARGGDECRSARKQVRKLHGNHSLGNKDRERERNHPSDYATGIGKPPSEAREELDKVDRDWSNYPNRWMVGRCEKAKIIMVPGNGEELNWNTRSLEQQKSEEASKYGKREAD
jgi:hypothetical protein